MSRTSSENSSVDFRIKKTNRLVAFDYSSLCLQHTQINVRYLQQQQQIRALKTQGSCLIKKDSKQKFQGRLAGVDTKFENLQ